MITPEEVHSLTAWSTLGLAIVTAILAAATIVLVAAALKQIKPAKEAAKAMRDAAVSSFEAERGHYEYARKMESWKAVLHTVESTREVRARLNDMFGPTQITADDLMRLVSPVGDADRQLAHDVRHVLNAFEELLSGVDGGILDANLVENMMRVLVVRTHAKYGPFIDHIQTTSGRHALSEIVKYAETYRNSPDYDPLLMEHDLTERQPLS